MTASEGRETEMGDDMQQRPLVACVHLHPFSDKITNTKLNNQQLNNKQCTLIQSVSMELYRYDSNQHHCA